jgi:hypothetical protein
MKTHLSLIILKMAEVGTVLEKLGVLPRVFMSKVLGFDEHLPPLHRPGDKTACTLLPG